MYMQRLSPFSKVYSSLSIYHQAAVTTMNQPPWAPLLPWTRLPPDRGKYSSTAGRISRPSLPCGRRLTPTAVIFSTISAYLGQSPIDWTASSNRPPRGNCTPPAMCLKTLPVQNHTDSYVARHQKSHLPMLSQGYDCGTVPDTVPTVILPVHTCQVATTSCFVVDPRTEMTSHVDARSSPLV
eukprot:scaffold6178_cov148-Skeletonema_marinoi.AAC.6